MQVDFWELFARPVLPGVDFVLNDKILATSPQCFRYPSWQAFFDKENEMYSKFRQTWILLRRLRPMVPCPEHCPMPSKRMSKETRSKMYSVYFRPWTLVPKVATEKVLLTPCLIRSCIKIKQPCADGVLSVLVREWVVVTQFALGVRPSIPPRSCCK